MLDDKRGSDHNKYRLWLTGHREATQLEETQMLTSVKQLMEAANAVVPKITPKRVR